MTASDQHVILSRLTGRSGAGWLGGLAAVCLAMAAYWVVTDPALWPLAAGVVVVLGLGAAWAATRVVLDAGAGTLTWRRVLLPNRTVAFAGTERLTIEGVGFQVQLVVRAGGRPRRAVLVMASDHRQVSQSAPMLRALADAVETHAPTRARGDVVGRLRAQATHLERGGGAASSPLAALARPGNIRAAGGAGAAGGGLGQL